MASPLNIFFISEMLIMDWSITYCDVTPIVIFLFLFEKPLLSTNIFQYVHLCAVNRIGSVIVSVLASSAVDRGFEPHRL